LGVLDLLHALTPGKLGGGSLVRSCCCGCLVDAGSITPVEQRYPCFTKFDQDTRGLDCLEEDLDISTRVVGHVGGSQEKDLHIAEDESLQCFGSFAL
jgi:hypothetical protein